MSPQITFPLTLPPLSPYLPSHPTSPSQSSNKDVRYCAVMAMAAYARDVTQEHSHGLDLLRGSQVAPELIAVLLPILEETVVMQAAAAARASEPGANQEQQPLQEVGKGEHPLLSLIEGAAVALHACVIAQVDVGGDGSRAAAAAAASTALSFDTVSRIARLVQLLGQQLQGLLAEVAALTARIPATEAAQESEGDLIQELMASLERLLGDVLPHASSAYCLLSCLACAHQGPAFLASAHSKLSDLAARLAEQEQSLGEYRRGYGDPCHIAPPPPRRQHCCLGSDGQTERKGLGVLVCR